VREREPVMLEQLVEQAKRSAINVFCADDVVTGAEELHEGIETPHAAREREPVPSILERGYVSLERLARWVLSARVFISFVLAEAFLNVGGREIHRRHDR